MLRVFISYHHRKSARQAKRVRAFLEKQFPLAKVFLDTESLGVGDEWQAKLAKALFGANVYICLIDDQWEFRVWHPGSFVRRELEVATFNPNKNRLLPLVLGPKRKGNDPFKPDLPATLKKVLDKQYVEFTSNRACLEDLENRLKDFWTEAAKENDLPILFISSPIAVALNESLEYFSLVASELAFALQHDNRRNLPVDFVLKAPNPKDPSGSQLAMIRELRSSPDKYLAVVVSPYETDQLERELAEFVREHPRVPVFTFDKCFSDSASVFQKKGSKPPTGVMNDWEHGGGLAANSLLQHFSLMGFRRPKVVVIEGLEGSPERIQGFENQLRKQTAVKVKLDKVKGGNFRRNEARVAADTFLRKINPGEIHGFFCTNDEMALGVWDSVRSWEKHHGSRSGIRIVGYDGIRDLTSLIQQEDHLLLNTVDVCIAEQVRQLASMLFETLLTPNGVRRTHRIAKVKGHLFLDGDKQRERSQSDLQVLQSKQYSRLLQALRT